MGRWTTKGSERGQKARKGGAGRVSFAIFAGFRALRGPEAHQPHAACNGRVGYVGVGVGVCVGGSGSRMGVLSA